MPKEYRTVAQLIEELQKFPSDSVVMYATIDANGKSGDSFPGYYHSTSRDAEPSAPVIINFDLDV